MAPFSRLGAVLSVLGMLACAPQAPARPILQNPNDTNKNAPTNTLSYCNETYRPQFHFSPATDWAGNVNGAVLFNGVYHLFYQYDPFGMAFSNQSWGHATSTDLLHWTHQPVALWEDGLNVSNIGSGTAAVDYNDDGGFCTGLAGCAAMVAFYTDANNTQKQAMAHSIDRGVTWQKDGTIIANQTANNRDMKAFYYGPGTHWNAMVTYENGFVTYLSTDLHTWTQTQHFTSTNPNVWEGLDMFTLRDTVTGLTNWVQVHDEGGLVHYMVGAFDGYTFTAQNANGAIVDYSPDYYAAITYNVDGTEETRRINMGWLRDPAPTVALTPTWFNAHSAPRQFTLVNGVLHSQPIAGLATLHNPNVVFTGDNFTVSPNDTKLASVNTDLLDATLVGSPNAATQVGMLVRSDGINFAAVYYNAANGNMVVDRTMAMNGNWNASGTKILTAPAALDSNGNFALRMLVDRNSIEVYDLNGGASLTAIMYPFPFALGTQFLAVGGTATMVHAEVHGMTSIWPTHSRAVIPLTNWQPIHQSQWASTDFGLLGMSPGGDVFNLSMAQTANDLMYEADINPMVGATALVFRATADGNNAYGVSLDATHGVSKIIRWNAASSTDLMSVPVTFAFPPVFRHVKVTMTGPIINAYLDGSDTPLMTYTDITPLPGGYVGVNVWGTQGVINNIALTINN